MKQLPAAPQEVLKRYESGGIWPSTKLFRQAIDAFDAPLSDMVFVGDGWRVDIAPAKALGLDAVRTPGAKGHRLADRAVRSLLELEELAVDK